MNCFYCKEPLPTVNVPENKVPGRSNCARCVPLAEYDLMLKRIGVDPSAAPNPEGMGGHEAYHKRYDLHNPNRIPLKTRGKRKTMWGSNRKGFRKQPDGTWKKVSDDYITDAQHRADSKSRQEAARIGGLARAAKMTPEQRKEHARVMRNAVGRSNTPVANTSNPA